MPPGLPLLVDQSCHSPAGKIIDRQSDTSVPGQIEQQNGPGIEGIGIILQELKRGWQHARVVRRCMGYDHVAGVFTRFSGEKLQRSEAGEAVCSQSCCHNNCDLLGVAEYHPEMATTEGDLPVAWEFIQPTSAGDRIAGHGKTDGQTCGGVMKGIGWSDWTGAEATQDVIVVQCPVIFTGCGLRIRVACPVDPACCHGQIPESSARLKVEAGPVIGIIADYDGSVEQRISECGRSDTISGVIDRVKEC